MCSTYRPSAAKQGPLQSGLLLATGKKVRGSLLLGFTSVPYMSLDNQPVVGFCHTALAQRTWKYKLHLLGPLLKQNPWNNQLKGERSIRLGQVKDMGVGQD